MLTFVSQFGKSFLKVWGPAWSILGVIVPFLIDQARPGFTFDGKLTLCVAASLLILVVTLFHMSWVNRFKMPKVLCVAKSSFPVQDTCILITEPSEFFGTDSAVSIFLNQVQANSVPMEILIGYGRVQTIHSTNKTVQIEVVMQVSAHAKIWEDLRNNDHATREQLVVKPTIPYQKEYFENNA